MVHHLGPCTRAIVIIDPRDYLDPTSTTSQARAVICVLEQGHVVYGLAESFASLDKGDCLGRSFL